MWQTSSRDLPRSLLGASLATMAQTPTQLRAIQTGLTHSGRHALIKFTEMESESVTKLCHIINF